FFAVLAALRDTSLPPPRGGRAMKLERLRTIRESASWVVWRGKDRDGKRYTVKQVRPGSAVPDYLYGLLQEEYEFFLALDHPGLLGRAEWDEEGPAIRFEDTQGSLAQLIEQEGKLPVELVANVLHEGAGVLDYLHGRKLGHGLVNTRTILVAPDG